MLPVSLVDLSAIRLARHRVVRALRALYFALALLAVLPFGGLLELIEFGLGVTDAAPCEPDGGDPGDEAAEAVPTPVATVPPATEAPSDAASKDAALAAAQNDSPSVKAGAQGCKKHGCTPMHHHCQCCASSFAVPRGSHPLMVMARPARERWSLDESDAPWRPVTPPKPPPIL